MRLTAASKLRITPAHAGKSHQRISINRAHRDHPRACGEKWRLAQIGRGKRGSPPRMRGKGWLKSGEYAQPRITPAHAGKRTASLPRLTRRRDHPRACGEKMVCYDPHNASAGSPPRMRGKVVYCMVSTWKARITPAHAGKRRGAVRWPCAARDHPRACGEKCQAEGFQRPFCGSPPRMRGKGGGSSRRSRGAGITPAHAGKSSGRCGLKNLQ